MFKPLDNGLTTMFFFLFYASQKHRTLCEYIATKLNIVCRTL